MGIGGVISTPAGHGPGCLTTRAKESSSRYEVFEILDRINTHRARYLPGSKIASERRTQQGEGPNPLHEKHVEKKKEV